MSVATRDRYASGQVCEAFARFTDALGQSDSIFI